MAFSGVDVGAPRTSSSSHGDHSLPAIARNRDTSALPSVSSSAGPAGASRERLPFLVALRALAALIIVWHHFSIYAPLSQWAAPLAGEWLDWLAEHARATQVFFVIGGYVMARSMASRLWDLPRVRRYVLQRYLRLGLPYLGVIVLILPVYEFARGWLPEDVIGAPVSVMQFLAHLFFLQGALGHEQLSAGLWFVCINFQLSLIYALCLWLRDAVGNGRADWVAIVGWPLAILSLFHINLDSAWDNTWLYFFPYFFMGVVVQGALHRGKRLDLVLYVMLLLAAMAVEWRWRLAVAMGVGLILFLAEQTSFASRWPRSRILQWLGEISFSLFLIHFPVLVFVGTVWARMDWSTPEQALAGLLAAFALSLVAATAYHHVVERPAARLLSFGRRVGRASAPALLPA